MRETAVLPANAPERVQLEAQGWTVVARSFGAQLDADRIDREALTRLIERGVDGGVVRELDATDVSAVLQLDRDTVGDYPGSVATRHTPLNLTTATLSAERRAFGVVSAEGELVAMTYLVLDGQHAETDFTVVRRAWRGRGVGAAVKAASVLALADEGVSRFRTGGSAENAAILAANSTLGYVRDEEWVTLRASGTDR